MNTIFRMIRLIERLNRTPNRCRWKGHKRTRKNKELKKKKTKYENKNKNTDFIQLVDGNETNYFYISIYLFHPKLAQLTIYSVFHLFIYLLFFVHLHLQFCFFFFIVGRVEWVFVYVQLRLRLSSTMPRNAKGND